MADTPKPGVKSSEFWLSLLAVALDAAVVTGLIPTEGTAAKVAATVMIVLAALGYTAARTVAKRG